MTNWYPAVQKSGVKHPATILIETDVELGHLLDNELPDGFNELQREVDLAAQHFGYPCFLRTGHTSGKHEWDQTCCLRSPSNIFGHIKALVEHSEMAGLIGLPYDVWAVREMLPTEPAFFAFNGRMPITKERRVICNSKPIGICNHPYWWPAAIQNPSRKYWKALLESVNWISKGDEYYLLNESVKVFELLAGFWSIDWLWVPSRGWICTDMAVAEQSFHWPECDYCPEEMKRHYLPESTETTEPDCEQTTKKEE
jgi:hypothetical protein